MIRISSGLSPKFALRVLAVLALVLLAVVLLFSPPLSVKNHWWVLVPVMALLAEFLPVHLDRFGVRVTFSLPYIVAIAVSIGPVPAITTDVAATLLGGVLLHYVNRTQPSRYWLTANVMIAAVSVALASLCMLGIQHVLIDRSSEHLVATLGFLVTYVAVNCGLLLVVENTFRRQTSQDNLMAGLRLSLGSLLIFAVVGVAATSLARAGLYWMVPITLVPIWCLRTGLQYRAKMYDHYYQTIAALTQMLQRCHPYTQGHVLRVGEAAELVGRKLGVPHRRAKLLREAAVLHDIGKLAVDEKILDKPARLTEEEYEHVKRHALAGAEILRPVEEFGEIVHWVRHHHERPDGTGYPDRLPDHQIPIESKIIAVIDAFDAMTGGDGENNQRGYREPKSVPDALAELERCAGTQFDRRVVDAFRDIVQKGAFQWG